MDLGEKDKFGMEKRGEEDHHLIGFHGSSNMPSEWRQLQGDPQMGLQVGHDASGVGAVCQGDHHQMCVSSSSCAPASIADAFGHRHWPGLPASSQQLGLVFCDAAVSPAMAAVPAKNPPVAAPPGLDVGWNAPDSVPRLGMFLHNGAGGMLPPSLQSQFPADSAFIERAARFSCFNGVSFGGMMSPFATGAANQLPGAQAQTKNEGRVLGAGSPQTNASNMSLSADNTAAFNSGSGSPLKTQQRDAAGSLHGIGIPGNDAGEPAEFSGGGREGTPNSENTAGEPSSKGLISAATSKKRKKANQDLELDQLQSIKGDTAQLLSVETPSKLESVESKQKAEQRASTSPSAKPGGTNGGAADGGKEDYIHVRARRGQATNSHSLAERLRREKISERMKFLQDLVPGCSKVTGKAVMLDEIINYVQSLQRQVEFLSMKLAAVNPRLDFNIEGLLSKEILLQSRGAISSSTPFGLAVVPEDMTHHHHGQRHPTQQAALVQSGIPGMLVNPASSDAHSRRSINAQLLAMNAYKETAADQIPNSWDDELHNVVQMGFNGSSSAALSIRIQDLHGSTTTSGHMKVEP